MDVKSSQDKGVVTEEIIEDNVCVLLPPPPTPIAASTTQPITTTTKPSLPLDPTRSYLGSSKSASLVVSVVVASGSSSTTITPPLSLGVRRPPMLVAGFGKEIKRHVIVNCVCDLEKKEIKVYCVSRVYGDLMAGLLFGSEFGDKYGVWWRLSESRRDSDDSGRWYGYIRNHKKNVKKGQARTRESEEYKKKPKIQSRSQKCQASVACTLVLCGRSSASAAPSSEGTADF
ncbi:hypothetical protein Tco_0299901 [Tanacetum coccineum]